MHVTGTPPGLRFAVLDILRTSLAWAFAGSAAGSVLARLSPWNPDLPFPLLFAPLAFAVGLVFSLIVIALGWRASLHRRSFPAAAALGAASGLVVCAVILGGALSRGASVWAEFLLFGPPLAVGGAVCAVGTFAVARRASDRRSEGDGL